MKAAPPPSRRVLLGDAAFFVVLALASATLLHRAGFRQISDDDYARVTIAQRFAVAPAFDASRTSWLPLPFWLLGAPLAALGRSLTAARVVGAVMNAFALALPRITGDGRLSRGALVGAQLALLSVPWIVWAGAAPVPEALVTGLVVAAALTLLPRADGAVDASNRAAPFLVLAATLSRYEAWPIALLWPALARRHGKVHGAAFAPLLGPAAWLLTNQLHHGDFLHFVARVAGFRQRSGAGQLPLAEKLITYPRALVDAAPALVLAAALTLAVAVLLASTSPTRPSAEPETARSSLPTRPSAEPETARSSLPTRPSGRLFLARWSRPLLLGGALVTFLVYGITRDGAPTHHPERPLLPALALLPFFLADAVATVLREAPVRARAATLAAVAFLAVFQAAALREAYLRYPGDGPTERREGPLAAGAAHAGEALTIAPCAYEHFAFLAAHGAPERVTVLDPVVPGPITAACPRIVDR